MANLQTVALAAVQPTGNNDEIFVWYQKHPGYAAFARTKLSDALIGIVPMSAGVEEVVADSAKPELAAAGGGGSDEEEKDVYKPFVSSWSFTKAVIKSTVFVFGVRDDNQVCMISPTYEPIFNGDAYSYSVAACGIPAAAGGQKENVLIYYLWQENEHKDPKLVEYSLLNPKRRRTVLNILPSPKSRLCAYHNPAKSQEFCFFIQDKTIHWREARRHATGNIHHTKGVSETSPMAICIYRTVPVLFYFSTEGVLMVTEHAQDNWQESRAVSPTGGEHLPKEAHPNSDLAAVADRTSNNIVLYYREKDSENEYDTYVWRDPKIKNS